MNHPSLNASYASASTSIRDGSTTSRDTLLNNHAFSSCNCYQCESKTFAGSSPNGGYPTNMSVPSCTFPRRFACYDRESFREEIEPKYDQGFDTLNTTAITDKYALDFQAVHPKNPRGKCDKVQYASMDPRLTSPQHSGLVMTLDRPPLNGAVPLTQTYNEKLRNYGQGYKTYSDIIPGDILYYVDRSRQNPFAFPNYTIPATMHGTLFQDPMGSLKPQYDRTPIKCNNPITGHKKAWETGLSFLSDTGEFREDLMARQSRKRNQQSWVYRWPVDQTNNPGTW